MSAQHKQIGDVAERTGLSLRTIRYYEEVGLITPSARSHGGFRLYTEADIERLMLVKRMKPLGFSIDEMRDLLLVTDTLENPTLGGPAREAALARLDMYQALAQERCVRLREQLVTAEEFAQRLRVKAHAAAERLRDVEA